MSEQTLDCTVCEKVLPINEMYSVDACSEKCQDEILEQQKIDTYKCDFCNSIFVGYPASLEYSKMKLCPYCQSGIDSQVDVIVDAIKCSRPNDFSTPQKDGNDDRA